MTSAKEKPNRQSRSRAESRQKVGSTGKTARQAKLRKKAGQRPASTGRDGRQQRAEGKTERQLRDEIEGLRVRLAEAEETLRAIREGEVDAVVVSGTSGDQIYSLVGAESVYRLIVETMKEAAFTATFDGVILFCNARFSEFVKLPLEQIVGQSLSRFVTLDNQAAARNLLALSKIKPVKQRLVFQASDGASVPAHLSSSILHQPDGLSICMVATDLTELEHSTEMLRMLRLQREDLERANAGLLAAREELSRRNEQLHAAEEELRQQNQQLRSAQEVLERKNEELRAAQEESARWNREISAAKAALERAAGDVGRSNRDLEQFAYVASHDLQEPLRAVTGFLTLLEDRYGSQLDEKARGFIGYAVEGAQRMSDLIHDLLAYSRLERTGTELVPVDAGRALAVVLANLEVVIREAGARITRDDSLPRVVVDEGQLRQVFQNLIGNAVKFRKKDAPCHIHVGADRDGANWVFTVRDNGIGIGPPYHERIFEIFQRLHAREDYPGTGIGLAICKRIVERHGGRIWVDSQAGRGTTFFFSLPGTTG